jgi:hypothetical protein
MVLRGASWCFMVLHGASWSSSGLMTRPEVPRPAKAIGVLKSTNVRFATPPARPYLKRVIE